MVAPVASVIIPCRNAQDTLMAALRGPLSSALEGMEILAVDDGSTDDTLRLLQDVASKDSRVKILQSGGNGVSAARNLALDNAGGEFIFFVDADDVVESDFFIKAVDMMRRDNADYCRVAHDEIFPLTSQRFEFPLKSDYRFGSASEILTRYLPCFFGYSFAQVRQWYNGTPLFSRREMATVWSGVFRLDIIRNNSIRFDERIVINEDAMFLCEYLLKCSRTTSIDTVFYHYTLSAAGALRTKSSGPQFFANKLRLLEIREELDIKSGGRLTAMYTASCVFSLLEILRSSFRIKGCFFLGLSTFMRYGSDPVVKVALKHFPLSFRKPVLMLSVAACRLLSVFLFRRRVST